VTGDQSRVATWGVHHRDDGNRQPSVCVDLFTIPLSKSLQAQLSAVQITFTVFILTETWLVLFEGYLVDRLGARLIVTLGGILVALSWVGPGVGQSLSRPLL
jgi:MFS family permease